jgi:hypothetical protein
MLYYLNCKAGIKLTTDYSIVNGQFGLLGFFKAKKLKLLPLCEFTEHVGFKRAHGIANAQACLNSA